MLFEIWGGFKMALKRWPAMVVLGGLIVIACVVLSIALGDVLSQVDGIKAVGLFRERHAVTFTPYYPYGFDVSVQDDTVKYLLNLIERQKAYTAVVGNMRVDEPDFADGHATLALFGDAVFEMFPDIKPYKTASLPLAVRGSKLQDENIDYINFAGVTIPIVQTLPTGAAFFDANFGVIPLDRQIVILMTPDMFSLLDATERQEALHRAVLFDPSDEMVDRYVSGCAQGGLFLIEQDTRVLSRRFNEFLMVSAMYIIGMFAFLALALFAFVSSASNAIGQEMPAFKIREMYGASPMHLSLRIGSFLAVVILVLPVGSLSFLLVLGGSYATAAIFIILALVLNFVVLWFKSIRQVHVHDKNG